MSDEIKIKSSVTDMHVHTSYIQFKVNVMTIF